MVPQELATDTGSPGRGARRVGHTASANQAVADSAVSDLSGASPARAAAIIPTSRQQAIQELPGWYMRFEFVQVCERAARLAQNSAQRRARETTKAGRMISAGFCGAAPCHSILLF